jgi:2,4-dienoyl-CoA reductase-like NADH-dependent reductase (Old Yellow Enzyme family)
MKQSKQRVKQHIISMRISAEEWDSLHETMKCLQFQRVSDLMREAFKLVLAPTSSFETVAADGPKRAR